MKIGPSTKIQRSKDIIFKEMDGIVYILNHQNATIHTLNESASYIWRQVKIPLTVKKLTSLLCQQFDVDKKKATKDISGFASKYLKQGFLKTK